jgi:ParB family chromosome partitioning protein
MADRHKRWAQRLSEPEAVWPWLGEQTMETRLELLAFLIASAINAVDTRRQAEPIGRLNHAEILAKAAQLDMTRWWRPTARDYFNRVSKEKIVEAVAQQQGQTAAENISRMKKQSMAIRAEQLLADSGWLPELFRKPSLSPSTSLALKDQ